MAGAGLTTARRSSASSNALTVTPRWRNQLLAEGKAYKCFSTQEEIQTFRDEARAAGKSTLFRSPWRDADPRTSHPDAPYVVRIKAPQEGEHRDQG